MKKCIPVIVLSLLPFSIAAGIAEGLSPEAALEAAEDKEASRLLEQNTKNYYEPVSKALAQQDFEKVVSLSEAASQQWLCRDWKSPSARRTRRIKIVGYLFTAAENLERLGRYEQAAECYLKCNDIGEKNGLSKYCYLPQVASAYRVAKQYSKSEEIYKAIIQANENVSETRVKLATLYEDWGKLDLAETTLRDGLRENSRNRLILMALQDLLQKEKRNDEARLTGSVLADRHCPVCGSDSQVIAISYGMPSFPHTKKEHLGGCVYTPGLPEWWCEKDEIGF